MDSSQTSYNDCFIAFKSSIKGIDLPLKFTFPFNYTPHPLCKIAAEELQYYLLNHTTWNHDFGIDVGKMFGVLIVRTPTNDVGYLAAFSGKVGGENIHPHFVPPIVDMLREGCFWRVGEDEISAINHRIESIEASEEFLQVKSNHKKQTELAESEISHFRQLMKLAKKERDAKRANLQSQLSDEAFDELKEQLKNESLKLQYDEKQLLAYWRGQTANSLSLLNSFTDELERLKIERKTKSAALQQQLFDEYYFLNKDGQTKSVCDIFAQTDKLIPPAGAGDCAAPRLLQFAFAHRLQPLAMAEFWWGQSPKTEIRQHGHFYPSCRGKCEPILGYMLQGIEMDENPIHHLPKHHTLEIIYEDNAIGVLNKPAEFLSVPAKYEAPSVYSMLREKYPNAKGPMMVHRLDLSTSGVMVFAKTMQAYHSLQEQFLKRTVKKRYVALLDGVVASSEGIIDLPLRVDLDNRPHQLVCYDYGKPAVTKYRVLSVQENRTRIQFEPITGRTHQLRVHAAHPQGLNCPILGDDLYGEPSSRLHLHAEFIQFNHPVTNELLSFHIPAEF